MGQQQIIKIFLACFIQGAIAVCFKFGPLMRRDCLASCTGRCAQAAPVNIDPENAGIRALSVTNDGAFSLLTKRRIGAALALSGRITIGVIIRHTFWRDCIRLAPLL